MRHRKAGLKLNRSPSHRHAMFRNMVTSLLKHDRIRTTGARAKEVRRWADHIITLAKRGDLHARRQALSIVREKEVVHKLFDQADERFGAVSGGYTRVVKLGKRPGDAASMSMVELITLEGTKKKKTKKKKAKAEGKQKKAVDKKAPAVDKDVKGEKGVETDEKKPASTKTDVEATEKKEVAKVEKKAKAATKAVDTKDDKPVKKAKSSPKQPAVKAEKKDTADSAKKKAAPEKSVKDEK